MTPDELAKSGPKPTWPIGFYAPGDYACTCVLCGKQHFADKRAVHCADCTLQACYREVERLRKDYFAAEVRGMERAAEIADAVTPTYYSVQTGSGFKECHNGAFIFRSDAVEAIRAAAREIKP